MAELVAQYDDMRLGTTDASVIALAERLGIREIATLDRTGEFTAEVPTSTTGQFRFFAGPGDWTLRTLAPKSVSVDNAVTAAKGTVAEVLVAV